MVFRELRGSIKECEDCVDWERCLDEISTTSCMIALRAIHQGENLPYLHLAFSHAAQS
jgi:hypothetical protein